MNSKKKFNRNKNRRKGGNKSVEGRSQPSKTKTQLLNEEIQQLTDGYKAIQASKVEKFTDFPLCMKTKKGLLNGKYETPTSIQKQAIGLALQGNDILGAAKTGSGKTLAFLIPVLERLFVQKWSQMDGLGALIISPTRELAYQIFEVLRVVGKFHDFSAGLVIGGKHLREESQKINNTNVIICTPGRLLQHMDETFNFNADNLQVLVLDEADRILDMGFKDTMNAIIQNLPPKRQTLLFSATQTKSVKDLARLSLKDPMYVSVHENAEHSTPSQLTQSYMVCELNDKMNMLWSFIKNHLRAKTLVFMTSCKQVRYIYHAIKHMRPGVPVLCLHGAMQQLKRVTVYNSFKNQRHVVLLATDIAARGLDFPSVNWVIQLDCPDDPNTYIHRAGRTARYEHDGEALLVLTPSEEQSMVEQLAAKKIPIERIEVNKERLKTIDGKLEAFCASRVDMKEFAQRCFVSYLKAVFYMKDKSVFDVSKLDTDSYARSLGLAVIPRVRFLEKKAKQSKAENLANRNDRFTQPKAASNSDSDSEESSEEDSETETKTQKPNQLSKKSAKKSRTLMENEDELENSDSDSDSDGSADASDNAANKSDNSESEDVNSENESDENESDESENESDDSENENESNTSDSDDSENELVSNIKSTIAKQQNAAVETKPQSNTVKTKKEKLKVDKNSKSELDFGTGNEDADDLFTVNKSPTWMPSSSSSEDEKEEAQEAEIEKKKEASKHIKVLTKAGLAKKLAKKNIKINKKVTFDEEGQEVPKEVGEAKISDDEDDYEGGIDINKAQALMKKRDALDKKIFQERIKKKRQEKKLKEKARSGRKKKQQASDDDSEGEAFLASGSDEGNINEDGWNSEDYDRSGSDADEPNPAGSEEGSASEDGDEDSESDNEGPPAKRTKNSMEERSSKAQIKTKVKQTPNTKHAAYATGQSLQDDEMMALHLLSSGS